MIMPLRDLFVQKTCYLLDKRRFYMYNSNAFFSHLSAHVYIFGGILYEKCNDRSGKQPVQRMLRVHWSMQFKQHLHHAGKVT